MANVTEIVAVISATVSAVAGLFSAVAACRSAGSARAAQKAAVEADRRASIRHIRTTALDVVMEAGRVEARGKDVKRAYQSLFAFSGGHGSRHAGYQNEVDKKLTTVCDLVRDAESYSGNEQQLRNAVPEEIDRVQTTLLSALSKVRAIREDFDREYAGVESQCAVYRERVIKG